MLVNDKQELEAILDASAEVLDVPDYVYEDATLKYEDVAAHLASSDSALHNYAPQIYVQGSFRLGTVVQPIGHLDEYDVDLVCRLEIDKTAITQLDLKSKVGDRLKVRGDLAAILEESRRCWVLDYPAQTGLPSFHMDVLPSIPNMVRGPDGILLTDKELRYWQASNPVAYSNWFKSRMEVVFRSRRVALADSISASIEDIPDWQVKTPLQRSIQILKRHRDLYFQERPDEKPISIILTTLAARAYCNEEDIVEALSGIVSRMPHFIENRDGVWWVANPVEPLENFADKWKQYPERKEAFIAWLDKVGADFSEVSRARSVSEGLVLLNDSLGRATMNRVASKIGVPRPNLLVTVPTSSVLAVPAIDNTSHVLAPSSQFPVAPVMQYRVQVSGRVYVKLDEGRGRYLWGLTDRAVPKNVWLKFSAKTNFSGPHSIRWQVVNTGQEARLANQPRGDFYESDNPTSNVRWECTAYRGTHWIEAFVLNTAGVCVGRSGRVLVKVR